jgi:hypothetical protein
MCGFKSHLHRHLSSANARANRRLRLAFSLLCLVPALGQPSAQGSWGIVIGDMERNISLSALVTGRVCHRKVRGLARSPIAQRLRLDGPGGEVTRHVPGGGIRVVRGFVQVGQGEACRELAADLPGE